MTTRVFPQGTALALLAMLPLGVEAQVLDADVDLGNGGVSAEVGSGGQDGVDADVDIGGGNGGNSGGGESGVDADVGIGGGSGDGSNSGGGVNVDASVGGGAGGNGSADGGIGTGEAGGLTGAGVDGGGGSARDMILANGQPAGVLIGMIVYSSDGVALGVVRDIAGFDGDGMRLSLTPNASLGISAETVMIDVPVDRLTERELRLSLTRDEFVRQVAA